MGLPREESAALPRDTSASSPPPSSFGRYRVVHQVGVGVLGPVFRGYDPEQDRAVAIKAFPLDVIPERARELAADLGRLPTLGLEHPAIVAPLSAGAVGSTVYLVEEYFVAESADVALKQYGPAPVPDAVRLVGQLASALDTAAAAGVFHGSLHPRDILVAPHEVRLTGLGVAGALERIGVRVPTRRPYAAPERVAGGPPSASADVFSLACVAFELVTGRRPAQSGDTVTADTSAIEAPDAVALAEAFARALSGRPDDRHRSALAFAAALKHALTGEPLAAAAEPARPRTRRAGRSGPKVQTEPEPDFELIAPPADDLTQPLPADLLLAEPLGTESRYDASAALLEHEARQEQQAAATPSEPAGSQAHARLDETATLGSLAPAGTEPAPLEPAPIEPAALDPAALESAVGGVGRSEPAAPDLPTPAAAPLDLPRTEPASPADEYAIETVSLVARPQPLLPGEVCEAGTVPLAPRPSPLPLDLEAADASPTDSVPAAPAPPAAEPSPARDQAETPAGAGAQPPTATRSVSALAPLLAMLLLGVLIGFPAGYLMAPRAQPVAPAAPAPRATQAPAPAPAAVSAQPVAAPAPSAVPAQPAAAPAAAAPAPAQSTAPASQPRPSAPRPGAAASPAARPPERKAEPARTPPAPRSKPTTFVGSLAVVSRPAGATVKLDGRVVGVTPLTLREVSAGSHAIRLELDGYRVWSASAQVVAGQQNKVSASLERRDPRPGG